MKVNLEMDCSPWFHEDGTLTVGIWFGRECEPSLEESFSLKEMIDATLDSVVVGGKIVKQHYSDVEDLLSTLNELQEYTKNKVKQLGYDPQGEVNG